MYDDEFIVVVRIVCRHFCLKLNVFFCFFRFFKTTIITPVLVAAPSGEKKTDDGVWGEEKINTYIFLNCKL